MPSSSLQKPKPHASLLLSSTWTTCQTCEPGNLASLDMTLASCLSQMVSGESVNQPRGILCVWMSPPLSSLHWMRHLQPRGLLSPPIWGTFHIHRPRFITSAANFSSLDTTSNFRSRHFLIHWLRLAFPCNRRSKWVLPPLRESGS